MSQQYVHIVHVTFRKTQHEFPCFAAYMYYICQVT